MNQPLRIVVNPMVLGLRVSAAVLLFYAVWTPVWAYQHGGLDLKIAVISAAFQIVGWGLLAMIGQRIWRVFARGSR